MKVIQKGKDYSYCFFVLKKQNYDYDEITFILRNTEDEYEVKAKKLIDNIFILFPPVKKDFIVYYNNKPIGTISLNSFFDQDSDALFSYPNKSSLKKNIVSDKVILNKASTSLKQSNINSTISKTIIKTKVQDGTD